MKNHHSEIDSNRAGRLIGVALVIGGVALAIYMAWTAIASTMYPPRKIAGMDPLPQLRWESLR